MAAPRVTLDRSDPAADRSDSPHAQHGALAALAIAMLLAAFGTSSANVALPALADAFSTPVRTIQWVVLAYLLASTVAIVLAGRLGDVMGLRRVLLGGIGVFTGASILAGFAPALWVLIAARALQGAGGAVLMTLPIAIVRDTVDDRRTGSAMGLMGTTSAVGTALGPSLGGVLIAGGGWRAIFLGMAGLGLLSAILTMRSLPSVRSARTASTGLDGVGTTILGLTLTAYALAVTIGGSFRSSAALTLLAVTLIGICLVAIVESRVPNPLIPLATFADSRRSAGLAMNAVVATVMMTTLVVGPFFLEQALGLRQAAVGLVMSVGPLISIVTGMPSGRLVDRFGAPPLRAAGLAAMTLGTVGLVTLPPFAGLVGYMVAIAVLTPGYQLFQAANTTDVMLDVPPDQRGVISGLLSLFRNLGLITGASVMGTIFVAASGITDGATGSSNAVLAGLRATFLVATLLLTIALAAAIRYRHRDSS